MRSSYAKSLAGLTFILWFSFNAGLTQYCGANAKPFLTTAGEGKTTEVQNSTAQTGLCKTIAAWPL